MRFGSPECFRMLKETESSGEKYQVYQLNHWIWTRAKETMGLKTPETTATKRPKDLSASITHF